MPEENSNIPATDTPQPVIDASVPQPVPEPSKPKVNKKLVMAIAAVLLLLTAGSIAAYFLVFKNQTAQPSPIPTPEATATPDPTANWETYTNEKYGFSLKYPTGWTFAERKDANNNSTGAFLFTSPATSEKIGAYTLTINVEDTTESSIEDYVNSLISQNPVRQPGQLKFDERTQLSIDEQPAIKLSNVFAYDQAVDKIFILYNQKLFSISYPVGEENLNIYQAVENNKIAIQILSTFQFTD